MELVATIPVFFLPPWLPTFMSAAQGADRGFGSGTSWAGGWSMSLLSDMAL